MARGTPSRARSQPTRAPLRPQPARKRLQKPPVRHLRVIEGGREESQREAVERGGKLVLAMKSLGIALLVFGLVFLHIMLAQSSFELQKVHERVEEQEAHYRQMRFEVATAEAPDRIAEAAARLGLVVPKEQRYAVGPDLPAEMTSGNDPAGTEAQSSKQP